MSAVAAAPLTLLKLFQALKGNLKLVRLVKPRGVVLDLDTEQRDDRHSGLCGGVVVEWEVE